LSDIAREHGRGRRLFIGTVDLDARRLVIWDMGAIAAMASGGNGQAGRLFKKVLLASASIPVTFPPVFIDVEADGKVYREMHVDGGTLAQVFYIYGMAHHLRKAAHKLGFDEKKVKAELYVIRNGRVASRWQDVVTISADRRKGDRRHDGRPGDRGHLQLYAIASERGSVFILPIYPAGISRTKMSSSTAMRCAGSSGRDTKRR